MSNIYIQSRLKQKVIEIRGGRADFVPQAGASLDADNTGSDFSTGLSSPTALTQTAGYQLWNFVKSNDIIPVSYFIESSLNSDLVIDLEGGIIDTQSERGPALVLNRKTGATSQHWEFTPPDANGYFFIQSRWDSRYVIDIREEDPVPGTIQVFRQKNANTENQLWRSTLPYVDLVLHAPPSLIGPSVIYFGGGRVQIIPGNDPALGTTVVGNPFGLTDYPGGLGKPT